VSSIVLKRTGQVENNLVVFEMTTGRCSALTASTKGPYHEPASSACPLSSPLAGTIAPRTAQ